MAGVVNFAYIVLVAAGAYLYAVFTLGPPAAMGGFQQYVVGARLPVAAAVALASAICGILGCLIGVTGLKRLRADYQAMVMLVISILATTIIGADTGLFNGTAGLSLIPNPLASVDPAHRGWYYVAVVGGSVRRATWCCAGLPRPARSAGRCARCATTRTPRSPSARTWWACGWRCRRWAGSHAPGLSGGRWPAGFIGGWSPSAREYVETLALLTAIIVGGLGNHGRGAARRAPLVPVLILQGVQLPPGRSRAPLQLADDPRLGLILGLLTIAFVLARPQGLIPERRPRSGMPAMPMRPRPCPSRPLRTGPAHHAREPVPVGHAR